MQPLDFLAAVLPSSGLYCAAEFSSKKKEHKFVESLDDLYAAAKRMSDNGLNAYFALCSFSAHRRLAINAKQVKALFMDLDVGKDEEKSYPTRKQAQQAFEKFVLDTEMAALGQPFVVASGNGFHIYWPLDKDTDVADWKPVAENFKRLCQQQNLKIDFTVSADAARVLRVPSTINYNTDEKKPVKVIIEASRTYTLEELDLFIKSKLKTPTYENTLAALPGKPPKRISNTTAVKLFENNETLFKAIVEKTEAGKGCGQLAHYMENAASDGMEPLWRGLLSLAQKCKDGGEWAVRLSEMHPYTPDRMSQKLREIKGPYPCLKFDSENPGVCTNCPHFGKITNPLALGRVVATETEAKEIEISTPQIDAGAADEGVEIPKATLTRPAPPRGFSYGKNGAIFKETKVEDADGNEVNKQTMVLPYSLFVVNILQHDSEHIVHMLALRPEGATEVTLPQRAVVSKDDTVKNLAEQNIIASYGQGNDKNLFDYVRGCVEDASVSQRAIRVPENYGWQPDDTFVYNERIYAPNAVPRHVPMRSLANINKACTPTGSLENWQKVVNVLTHKKLYEILALSLVGFGAPLMRFTGYDGISFHLGSTQSGTGKSLTLELAASVWGHPTKYRVSKSTSDVAMQQRLGLLHSIPLISDEITNKNRKDFEWIAGFIFDMSEGQGKERMEAGANKERENNTYWKSMSLLSSNTHVMDYLTGARKHSSEGEIRRVLEQTMTSVIVWEPSELETVELIKTNYGVAGHLYAQHLVDNIDAVKRLIKEVNKKIKPEFKFKDDERFWHAGCTALIAGAILAKRAGIVSYPMEAIVDVLKGMVANARVMIKDGARSAEDVLNTYIRENYGKFVVVKALEGALAASIGEDKVIDQSITKSEILGRVEHGVTPEHVDFFIEEQLLKKYCSSMSFGYADFKREMEHMYHATYVKKDLMSKTKGPQMRVNAMKISRRIEPDEQTVDKVSLAAA